MNFDIVHTDMVDNLYYNIMISGIVEIIDNFRHTFNDILRNRTAQIEFTRKCIHSTGDLQLIFTLNDGNLHSFENEPAVEMLINSNHKFKIWYKNGVIHNSKQPAYIYYVCVYFELKTYEWWVNGKQVIESPRDWPLNHEDEIQFILLNG